VARHNRQRRHSRLVGQDDKPMGAGWPAGLNELTLSTQSVSAQTNRNGTITLSIHQTGTVKGGRFEHRHEYSFLPDGDILVNNTVVADESLPDLPRIGVTMSLAPAFENLTWLGRGPHENYCDRKRSAAVGLYSGTVRRAVCALHHAAGARP
jgi:beta-galactosidase